MHFDTLTLEFDKILNILQKYAHSDYTKEKISNLKIQLSTLKN